MTWYARAHCLGVSTSRSPIFSVAVRVKITKDFKILMDAVWLSVSVNKMYFSFCS